VVTLSRSDSTLLAVNFSLRLRLVEGVAEGRGRTKAMKNEQWKKDVKARFIACAIGGVASRYAEHCNLAGMERKAAVQILNSRFFLLACACAINRAPH
jgi:hypothetical protein